MRVGIDLSNLVGGLSNGTPVYLFNLVRGIIMSDADVELRLIYAHRSNPSADALLGKLADPRVVVHRTTFWRDGFPPGGWWYPRAPTPDAVLRGLDVFHGCDFFWPPPNPVPSVVSVLDATTIIHPETHRWLNRVRDAKKLRWAARADRVIAISQATACDIAEHTSIPADRIDVAPLACGTVDGAFRDTSTGVLARYGLAKVRYVLSVGTAEPRKNLVRLVRAFERLPDTFADVNLVLAGGTGWKCRELDRAIRRSPARMRIRRVGFVPAAALPAIYAGATVFAYPSLYEGFGLPLLEAMAAGTPVLTGNRSSLPEVAGGAALLVDPFSEADIQHGLERLLGDDRLRTSLAERGRRRARSFTWEQTARLTLASYRRAIRGRIKSPVPRKAGMLRSS